MTEGAPAGAGTRTWYVTVDGSNSAAGTEAAPFATIQKAVSSAQSGDVVMVGPGRYHEQVQVYAKDIDVRGAGIDVTVLDGTRPVGDWVAADGRWWSTWSTEFTRADTFQTTDARPEAGYPEQFFLDGVALREVAALVDVVAGTFYNDVDADRVWIGSDPDGRMVEGSDLTWGLYLNRADGSSISDLTVQRYATPQTSMAAIRMYANDLVADDVAVRQNAYGGISAIGNRITFSGVIATDNGQIGVHGHNSTDLTIRDSTVVDNNTELFDPSWAAGGLKVTRTERLTVADSTFERNHGPAVWADLQVTDVIVVRNVIRDNLRSGVMLELSSSSIVADNLITGNGQAGVYVLESQDTKLWHNAVFDNHWDLRILTGPRADVLGVDVFNNAFGGAVTSAQAIIHADDWTSRRSAAQMALAWDHNRIWWPTSSAGAWASRIQNWPAPQSLSTTIAEHRVATGGQEQATLMSRDAANPWARDYLAGDGRAPVGAPPGAALPADVAAALDLAPGTRWAPGTLSTRVVDDLVDPEPPDPDPPVDPVDPDPPGPRSTSPLRPATRLRQEGD